MKIDKYGSVELEQCSWPGNIGDGCAESSRTNRLLRKLNLRPVCDLIIFRTSTGWVRHPTAPDKGQLEPKKDGSPSDSWREVDFTDDQATVWFMEMKETRPELAREMQWRVLKSGFRTGKNFIHPGFAALLLGCKPTIAFTLWMQTVFFGLPYRVEDDFNKLGTMEDSSADYLNWIFVAADSYEWVRRLIDKKVLKSKVRAYYAKEPNSQWLIDLYDRFIDKYFF